jgi:hypothetical protein
VDRLHLVVVRVGGGGRLAQILVPGGGGGFCKATLQM